VGKDKQDTRNRGWGDIFPWGCAKEVIFGGGFDAGIYGLCL